jgi:imidazolonepropionase-like amidohydrolase
VQISRRPEPTLIRNVRVFEAESGTLGPVENVWLRDGRVFAVRGADPAIDALTPSDAGARIVDGMGMTLLPGLVDVHTHIGGVFTIPGELRLPDPERNLSAWVFAGVTTILDLSSPIADIKRWRNQITRRRWIGPHIYASGRPFGAPGGHPVATIRQLFPSLLVKWATRGRANEVATSADVDRAIAAEGPRDAIKVMIDAIPDAAHEPPISPDALARVRVAATALDRPLIAHVGRPADVHRALALPVDALAHLPYAGRLDDADVTELGDLAMPVTPTLAVWDSLGALAEAHPLDDALQAAVLTPGERRLFADAPDAQLEGPLAGWATEVSANRETRADNVRRVYDAGAQVLVGSDAPMLGLAAGAGTHRELDRLRSAGLTAAETLRAATWVNSRFLNPDAPFGAVRPGWEADLVLVRGDPLTDPDAIHRLVGVWVDGREVRANWPE